MELFIQFVVAVFATIAFAVLFSVPQKELPFCGFSGALGWIIYFILMGLDTGIVFSSLIATMCLTVFSRIVAVRRHVPVTVYLMTGIFPIVPGSGIFYTAYYMFLGDQSLSSQKAGETFQYAGAIALGILFGFGLPQSIFNKVKSPRHQ